MFLVIFSKAIAFFFHLLQDTPQRFYAHVGENKIFWEIFVKFVCEKSALLKVLQNVSRSVSSKSNIPALEGVHVSVKGSLANFEGFNMEFGIKTSLEVSEAEDGEIVIPAKIFTDIIKKLPDSLISVYTENLNVLINCLDCDFMISGFSADDFPSLPSVENESPILISSETMKHMIQQTVFSVDDSGDNNIHSGELWEVKNRNLVMVALDGYRMSVRREPVNIENSFKIVIPGKALSEILRLLPSDDNPIYVYLSERYAFFKLENYMFLSRLLDGSFTDYEASIPDSCVTKIRVNVNDAISALERVATVIDDRMQSPIRAIIEPPGSIKLSCSTSLGRAKDELDASIEGEILEIAFNDKYFIDALKSCDSDEVIIETTSSLRPIKIVPVEGDAFTFIIMPMRVKD